MSSQRKAVVVVAAGSGIGAAVTTPLHQDGDHVIAVDVRRNDAPAVHALL